MSIVKLDSSSFYDFVNSSAKTVLVDFYADWCPPCRAIAPIINEIESENPDIQVCKLNVDENPDIAGKFEVMSIPTLISFKDGKEYKRDVGVMPKPEILNLIK